MAMVRESGVVTFYLDAVDVLPPGVIANIESNKDKDPNWWNIYGLGKLGKVEGLALGPRLGGPSISDDGYAILAVEDDNGTNVVHAFRLRTVPEPAGIMPIP